jgi:hypothetical protein
MAPKFKDGDVVLAFSGKWVSWAHTAAAYGEKDVIWISLKSANVRVAAFLSAFFVGVSLHYHKIVENEWFGYPEEWFPSVSATIGDRYPERSFFMVFIAITSGTQQRITGI